jgi:hypothetical protein
MMAVCVSVIIGYSLLPPGGVVMLAMTNPDRCRAASVKGAQRRACAIMTLRADGRQGYGHGHASEDAVREE